MTVQTPFRPLSEDELRSATPTELARYEQDLIRESALLSPLDYAVYVSDGRFKRYKHTEVLSAYAAALVDHALYPSGIGTPAVFTPDPYDPEDGQWRHPETGEQAHNILVLSIPPQHGKSMTITETVPAWAMTRDPHLKCAVIGYEAEFAKGFGKANRDKIEAHPELGVNVSKDSRAADKWAIEGADGGLFTAGIGGGLSGKRVDVGIIDDPVKNQDDALSETIQKRNRDWWESVAKARIRTDTVWIVIQTRWTEEDLAGHLAQAERCYVLNIPALAFEDTDAEGFSVDPDTGQRDALNRRPGEALCPAIQTKSMLLDKKETGDGGDEPGGELWFSAMYQGKPSIQGAGIISKPFYYFTTEENFSGRKFYKTLDYRGETKKSYADDCIYFITADLASSTRTTADWTVFSLFAWTPHNQLLLVDLERNRLESPDHTVKATEFYNVAKARVRPAPLRFFGVENKTFGQSLIQNLMRDGHVPVRPLEADTDKVTRAIPVGLAIRQGEFFLPKEAEFLQDVEKEMAAFPNGKHDDMTDTIAYAVRSVRTFPRQRRTEEGLPETGIDRNLRKYEKKYRRAVTHPIIGRMR